MKKLLLVLSFISVFVLNGCLIEAFYVCSTLLTAKSAYNGYETITSLKSIKEGPPIFREYQVAYISIDVQPRKENSESVNHIMENVYCRTANAMSRESGSKLTFRPYDGEQVAACADALIIQVKENKPSMIGKIMSGDKIHASVKYIDKKSVRSVCEERYDIARDYPGNDRAHVDECHAENEQADGCRSEFMDCRHQEIAGPSKKIPHRDC